MDVAAGSGLSTAVPTVWQSRVDRWSSIADLAKQLSDAGTPAQAGEPRARELGGLLDLVAPVESYWAVPGARRVAELRELCDAADFETLATLAEPIARTVVGDPGSGGRDRPSFEVLLLADVPEEETEALALQLREFRRPDDPFDYQLVVVRSLEDALVAVLVNFSIQACVV